MISKNVLHTEHAKGINEHTEYVRILRGLGIEKSEDEPFTDCELRQIFMGMQEGLCS